MLLNKIILFLVNNLFRIFIQLIYYNQINHINYLNKLNIRMYHFIDQLF